MAGLILITISVLMSVLAILESCKCEIPGLAHYSNEDKSILANERLLQYIGPPQVYVPVCGPCQHQPQPQYQHAIACAQNHYHAELTNQHHHAEQANQHHHAELANQLHHGQVANQYHHAEVANQHHYAEELNHHHQQSSVQSSNDHHHTSVQGGGSAAHSYQQSVQHAQHGDVDSKNYDDLNYEASDDAHYHKKKSNIHYKFEYGVDDHKTGDKKHHKEERHGDVVRGEYSLLEHDGNVRTVKYYADWKTGFHAQVHNSKQRSHR